MQEEIVSLNDLAQMFREKGAEVDVYRPGRGRLGRFVEVKQCSRTRWVDGGAICDINPNFWRVDFMRGDQSTPFVGSEIVIRGDYHRLEFVKVNTNLFHIIVPA